MTQDLETAAGIGYASVGRPYGFTQEDVAQETALRVVARGKDLAEVDLPLLVTMAKGCAVDLVRKRAKDDAVPVAYQVGVLASQGAAILREYHGAESPEDALVAAESAQEAQNLLLRYARAALDRLAPQERTVAEAYYLGGMEHVAIGEALGLSRNAVKQALGRARAKLGAVAQDLMLLRIHYWHPEAHVPQGGRQAKPSVALVTILRQYSLR